MSHPTEYPTHGPYQLLMGPSDGVIKRQDPDHRRTVAYVDTREQWDKFVAALDAGADEVAAVHAIDAEVA
jgi:hypothetical protein